MPGLPKNASSVATPACTKRKVAPSTARAAPDKRMKGAPTPAAKRPSTPCSNAVSPWGASRRCASCLVRTTPQWRTFNDVPGIDGSVVLCNACGVRYVRSGQLHLAEVGEADEFEEPVQEEPVCEGTPIEEDSDLKEEGIEEEEEPEVGPPPYDFSVVPYCGADVEKSGSILLAVHGRESWIAAVDEMHALCNEATRRLSLRSKGPTVGLSREYIAQRAEIDDPLRGFMVRTRSEGWLQGFVWYTTFTTWTNFFKWDSLASQCGMRRQDAVSGRAVDLDGTLARELQAQFHEGDPNTTGVVWPRVAEVSLVGALGCGARLMQLALDELETESSYDYVVLQATKNSIAFYEALGFVRVGAVARYSHRRGGSATEVVGYRHWLGTDEAIKRTDRTSYMMARRLNVSRRRRHCVCGQPALRLWQAETSMLECGECHQLFHPTCMHQTFLNCSGSSDGRALWRCESCRPPPPQRESALLEDLPPFGLQQTNFAATIMKDQDILSNWNPQFFEDDFPGAYEATGSAGAVKKSSTERVRDRGSQEDGFLIMSRWGWRMKYRETED
ncbi:hypothetical protein CYMTET_45834 [Cymbomonas tetramitiformis]|uniref:PHD-type domain-containing protein n=1 Tax=Cymbomonas tetramitiformis TaxID=36881 RepID=A0AAE0EY75_9CHLO|nr:hypothetical protein CYMTET_45834 [Cymbomonas tetramitiformis]